MAKKSRTSYQRLERNIYVDRRNGAFRFRVAVYPLPTETRTFDREADGRVWALRTRQSLPSENTPWPTRRRLNPARFLPAHL